MGGRSRILGVLLASRLLLLLLLFLVMTPPAMLNEILETTTRLPTAILQLLRSRSVTLPTAAYSFDGIATGTQRYSEEARYLSLADTTPCGCRHRCLADVRCMGFEHQADTGACGLTDVLLPGDVTLNTAGGWTTGRRRGIRWLEAPCQTDSDCSLFISGATCGPERSCACPFGWSAVTGLLCRPDGRWVLVNDSHLEGWTLIGTDTKPSLQTCQDACRHTADCLAIDYDRGKSRCRRHAAPEGYDAETATGTTTAKAAETHCGSATGSAAGNATGTAIGNVTGNNTGIDTWNSESLNGIVSYVWSTAPAPVSPPEGFTAISGRFFSLTDEVPSTVAADACLRLGGVQHAPDNLQLLRDIFEKFEATCTAPGPIGTDRSPLVTFGVGISDLLEEGRFVTVDGSALHDSSLWAPGEPANNAGIEHCGFFDQRERPGFMIDNPCYVPAPHLCEHIGAFQLLGPPVGDPQLGNGVHGMTWWTYDFGSDRDVSRLLYVARGDVETPPEMTKLLVGQHPDRSFRRQQMTDVCAEEHGAFVAPGFARVLSCATPLTGRYLHIGQRPGESPQWLHIALFLD